MATLTKTDLPAALSSRHKGTMKLATHEERDYSKLRYDYEQIDAEHRERVQAAAVDILANGRRAKESILAMGERLKEVKALLPTGTFMQWVETEFELDLRTAENYMNVATIYGGRIEIISILNPTVLYLLAAPSTPDGARDEVEALALSEGRSPKVAEVRDMIAEHRGLAPVPAPEPESTPVEELQRLVGEWVGQRSKDPLMQLYYVKGVADGSDPDTQDRLVGYLKRVCHIDRYRDDDLTMAIQAEYARRKQTQEEKDAKRGPEPPSEWKLREAIEAWLAAKALEPKAQHAKLVALKEKEENPKSPFRDVEHQQFIAALPANWRKRELKQALSNLADHVSRKVGADEWETHELPSGRWYAQNKARNPSATGIFGSAEEALAAIAEANQANRQRYDQLDTVLGDEREHWRANEFFNDAAPELIAEAKLALDKLAAQADAPAYVAQRLKRIEGRLAAAQRLLELAAPPLAQARPSAADLTPPDLFDAGYMIVISPEGETFRWLNDDGEVGDWWQLEDAIADARKRIELTPAEPEPPASVAAIYQRKPTPEEIAYGLELERELDLSLADVEPVHPFEAWIAAMPQITGLYECRLLVELGQLGWRRAKDMDGSLGKLIGPLVTLTLTLIVEIDKKIKFVRGQR